MGNTRSRGIEEWSDPRLEARCGTPASIGSAATPRSALLALPLAFAIGLVVAVVIAFAFCVTCAVRVSESSVPEGSLLTDNTAVIAVKATTINQSAVVLGTIIYAVGASSGTKYSVSVHAMFAYFVALTLFNLLIAVAMLFLCDGWQDAAISLEIAAFGVAMPFYAGYPFYLVHAGMEQLPTPKLRICRVATWTYMLVGTIVGCAITFAAHLLGILLKVIRGQSSIASLEDPSLSFYVSHCLIPMTTLATLIAGFGLMWAVRGTVSSWTLTVSESRDASCSTVKRVVRTYELFAYWTVVTQLIRLVSVVCFFVLIPRLPADSADVGARSVMAGIILDAVGTVASVTLLSGVLDLFLRRVSPRLAAKLALGDGSGNAASFLDTILHSTETLDVRNQIEFLGNILPQDGDVDCIASFPGKYPEGWLAVTCGNHGMSAACVFTRKVENGLGQHAEDPEYPDRCYCSSIYGCRSHKQFGYLLTMQKSLTPEERQKTLDLAAAMGSVVVEEEALPEERRRKDEEARMRWEARGCTAAWGCAWFQRWQENIHLAVSRKQKLVVYFFKNQQGLGKVDWAQLPNPDLDLWDGVGLGGSQKAEVAFLDRMRKERGPLYDYEEHDAGQFMGRARNSITVQPSSKAHRRHRRRAKLMASHMSQQNECLVIVAVSVALTVPTLAASLICLV